MPYTGRTCAATSLMRNGSMHFNLRRCFAVTVCAGNGLVIQSVVHAAPTMEEALRLVPVQSDVDFDRPTGDSVAKCKLEAYPDRKGWEVRGESGQLLRRFHRHQQGSEARPVVLLQERDRGLSRSGHQFQWQGRPISVARNRPACGGVWTPMKTVKSTPGRPFRPKKSQPKSWRHCATEHGALPAIAAEHRRTGEPGSGRPNSRRISAIVSRRPRTVSPSWRKNQRIVDTKSQWLQFGASRPGVIPADTEGSTKDLLNLRQRGRDHRNRRA